MWTECDCNAHVPKTGARKLEEVRLLIMALRKTLMIVLLLGGDGIFFLFKGSFLKKNDVFLKL